MMGTGVLGGGVSGLTFASLVKDAEVLEKEYLGTWAWQEAKKLLEHRKTGEQRPKDGLRSAP